MWRIVHRLPNNTQVRAFLYRLPEYNDGDSKRGDISLQGRVTIKEMSLQEADGQMHAFEISNEIKYDNPLLVSASSASEKEKWLKYIRKVIAGETWDTIASSGRIAEHIGSMPFARKNKVFSDVETIAIISEIQRNHAFTLDTSTRQNTAHVVSVLYPTGVNQADTGKSLQEYATMRKHSKKRSESLFETMAAANDVNRRQCCESGSGLACRCSRFLPVLSLAFSGSFIDNFSLLF